MPSIIMSKLAGKLDPSVKKKAYAFLEKLSEDDTSPACTSSRSPTAPTPRSAPAGSTSSTGPCCSRCRARASATYVFHGIWPHDDAIAVARKTRLTVNPVNGIAEITTVPRRPAVTRSRSAPRRAARGARRQPPSRSRRRPPPRPLAAAGGLGLDRKDLVDVLGIDESLAERALAAADENALLAPGRATPWNGRALPSSTWPRDAASPRSRTG